MLPILHQSFWRDEAFSVLLALKNPWEIISLTTRDVNPPFYLFLLHYWIQLFGSSEPVVRTLSVLFSVVSVLVFFLIARKIMQSRFAIITTTIAFFLNPFFLQYAFEARSYSLIVFLTLLTVYFTLQGRHVLASIAIFFGILTHNFALFTFSGYILWHMFVQKRPIGVRSVAPIIVMPLIAILLWGSVLWQQWTSVARGFWIKPATNSIFMQTLESFTKGNIPFDTAPLVYVFSLILLFFALSYWVWNEKKEETYVSSLLFSLAGIPILITYVISALFVPIYHERYVIGSLPLFMLLTGYSLEKVCLARLHVQKVVLAFVAVYLMLLVQGSEQIVGKSTKAPINYGVSQVAKQASNGDIIIPEDILNFLEVKLYAQQQDVRFPVRAYAPDGKIPFYIGGVLFEKDEVIRELPQDKTIWMIKADGGIEKKN